MARPIDADALKELLIETLERIAKIPTMSHEEMHVVAACRMHCEMIDDAPTLDYAPVVRCKDCKYYTSLVCGEGVGWCDRLEVARMEMRYCSDGERKEDSK